MIHIAVIGTGNMGAPMSIHLARAGFDVRAYDIIESKLEPLEPEGVQAASDHADAVQTADAVLTMLPTGVEVKDVFEHSLFNHCQPNTLLIDSSTIELGDAQSLHATAKERGFRMLDAPVSGGTVGAHNAALTFMVGGDQNTLESARPVFEAMGKSIIHCGADGMGQAAKMCNNLMLGIQMASVAEGFSLAERVGLDAKTLYEVATMSSGNCFALTTFCPVPDLVATAPSTNGFKPGFSTDLMLKDMKIGLKAAKESKLDLPLAPHALAQYARFSQTGEGGTDFSGIIKLLQN